MPRYTQSTKDLLDSMMSDAKLNPVRQRELRAVMDHGRAAAPRPVRQPPNRRAAPFEDPLRGVALNPNLTWGHSIKTQPQIARENNNYRREQFAGGGRVVNQDEEKRKLQQINAYGHQLGQAQLSAAAAAAAVAPPPKPSSEAAQLHAQISAEIQERQAFVQQMRAVGNTEHEATMQQQISERMGELRVVEKHMQQDSGSGS